MFSKNSPRPSSSPSREASNQVPSIVSASLRIVGNLDSEGDIQVDGVVEGDVRTTRLTVSETGSVTGSIDADAVEVAGKITGKIRAKEVILMRTARVVADIVQERLSIESGALFEGNSRSLSSENSESIRKPVGPSASAGQSAPSVTPPTVSPPAGPLGAVPKKSSPGNGAAAEAKTS